MKEFLADVLSKWRNKCNTNVINSLYTPNIKKCPFCGGNADIFSSDIYATFIACYNCGAEVKFVDTLYNTTGTVIKWNRRATKEELKFGDF